MWLKIFQGTTRTFTSFSFRTFSFIGFCEKVYLSHDQFLKSMQKGYTHHIFQTILTCLLVGLVATLSAQITPPGYERELEMMKNQSKTSIMERDSVVVVETVKIYDPETDKEETNIVETKMSVGYYCREWLGIMNPDVLLDGKPRTITDPKTYEQMKVRWNAQAAKIDTIPN